MICDHDRCFRVADVTIPEYAAYCSAHANTDLGIWPSLRYEELTSPRSRIHPRGDVLERDLGLDKANPFPPAEVPAPFSVADLELRLRTWLTESA